MSTLKLPAASGGGSISIRGPSSSGSDVDVLDTSGNLAMSGTSTLTGNVGVGVSAAKKLHVKGSADMFRLETTDGTGNCTMTFWDASAQKAYVGFGTITQYGGTVNLQSSFPNIEINTAYNSYAGSFNFPKQSVITTTAK